VICRVLDVPSIKDVATNSRLRMPFHNLVEFGGKYVTDVWSLRVTSVTYVSLLNPARLPKKLLP
jgi:hypothetical protein